MAENDKPLPSLFTQARNFLVSYARWLAAGKPLRSPEYIARLFNDVCMKCPSDSFIPTDADSGRCVECGCYLRRRGTNYNKLAWPTEACPNGFFTNEVEDDPDE